MTLVLKPAAPGAGVVFRRVDLGGVEIPHELGLEGHSDADAVCHAIIDALLGAAALGDIGRHFPDTDPKYKDGDSRALLREVAAKVRGAGFTIANLDATLHAEAPKMAAHIPAMIAAERNPQVTRVHLRLMRIHSSVATSPASIAPTAKAKGTAIPTYPRYSSGGCTAIRM